NRSRSLRVFGPKGPTDPWRIPPCASDCTRRLAAAEADAIVGAVAAASDIHRTIAALWRIESARLIAGLARMVRDVGRAEELAQDALVVALERWPESGVPRNPGAWLMATAKHRAIDHLRRNKRVERKHEELGHELAAEQER